MTEGGAVAYLGMKTGRQFWHPACFYRREVVGESYNSDELAPFIS